MSPLFAKRKDNNIILSVTSSLVMIGVGVEEGDHDEEFTSFYAKRVPWNLSHVNLQYWSPQQ